MYIKTFEEFYQKAEELFLANQRKTRFSIKYRNREKKFVLKVTDDRICLKFLSKQQQDIKKIEILTTLFLRGHAASSSS
ncbi:putative signal recognition particle subunit SRP9 [Blattamonas nauphoetae]|uniref:Signal recognition particle 9 kDa protein n=1 Tax=Blattamonas nauphoetae TaxID=2049346 RepID=A0ABQ9YFK7_9EUKA|nr:putative signal recognition particle subunit SRP9 [Blattamonas nauphoetae]